LVLTVKQLTAPDDDGMYPEPKFIEQLVIQQRLPERAMAVYDKVPAVLLLEFCCLYGYISADDVELFQSAFFNVDEKTYLRMLFILRFHKRRADRFSLPVPLP
jgi:hypothetical protein